MKIETKYDVRQSVWIIASRFFRGKFVGTSVVKDKIFRVIVYRNNDIVYGVARGQYAEDEVFVSKEEAIANQKRIEQKRIDIIEGKL